MTTTKNFLLLGIITMLLLSACSENDCIENGMEFTWTTNRSIEIEPEVENVMIGDSTISIIEYQIKEGPNVLFEFNKFSNICDDDILDGSASKKFSMIIPSDSMSSFSYTDQEILETAAFYDIFAAPSGFVHQSVEEGEIIGRKIDENSWRISIDVVTKIQEFGAVQGDLPEVISIDTIFSLR